MYFLITVLEDSGYMARAAYVMDKLMSSLGLHGKTAISLVIGLMHAIQNKFTPLSALSFMIITLLLALFVY